MVQPAGCKGWPRVYRGQPRLLQPTRAADREWARNPCSNHSPRAIFGTDSRGRCGETSLEGRRAHRRPTHVGTLCAPDVSWMGLAVTCTQLLLAYAADLALGTPYGCRIR